VRVGSGKDVVRWLLAAWMLLATSMSSVSFVHSHRGGHLTHRHGASDHAICGPLAPEGVGEDHDAGASLSAVNVHHHGFVTLLGGVTCLPRPSGPTAPQEKSPCNWCCWAATVWAVQVVRAGSDTRIADRFFSFSDPLIAAGAPADLRQQATLCAGAAPTAPLCDRARHERSGVLLA